MKSLFLCKILALNENKDLLKYLSSYFSISSVKNPQTNTSRTFINSSQPSLLEPDWSLILQGEYKGLNSLDVAFWDKDLKKIEQVLDRINVGIKFISQTPGWDPEPIYLIWSKETFPQLLNLLEKNQEKRDN